MANPKRPKNAPYQMANRSGTPMIVKTTHTVVLVDRRAGTERQRNNSRSATSGFGGAELSSVDCELSIVIHRLTLANSTIYGNLFDAF